MDVRVRISGDWKSAGIVAFATRCHFRIRYLALLLKGNEKTWLRNRKVPLVSLTGIEFSKGVAASRTTGSRRAFALTLPCDGTEFFRGGASTEINVYDLLARLEPVYVTLDIGIAFILVIRQKRVDTCAYRSFAVILDLGIVFAAEILVNLAIKPAPKVTHLGGVAIDSGYGGIRSAEERCNDKEELNCKAGRSSVKGEVASHDGGNAPWIS